MASSDEAEAIIAGAARTSNAGLAANDAAAHPQGRRQGTKGAYQEGLDELAQETKRVTLLDREEQQLKGRKHVSRVLFVFGIGDERKTQLSVEQEFVAFRDKQEGRSEITGLLLFVGQAAVSFLEGPTELLFKAVELFHGLSLEVQATPAMPAPPADMAIKTPTRTESEAPVQTPRPALISALRILYFTELHGVRTSVGWCSFISTAKQSSTQGSLEDGCQEQVFMLYRKFLVLCMKVRSSTGNAAPDALTPDALQGHYRRQADFLPVPDEVLLLLGKQGAEFFFTFAEFQKVFMKPFQLVLNSELLWPMAPALSY